ncbi:hypothetical protein Tco_1524804 [Tanacetum coccineum]
MQEVVKAQILMGVDGVIVDLIQEISEAVADFRKTHNKKNVAEEEADDEVISVVILLMLTLGNLPNVKGFVNCNQKVSYLIELIRIAIDNRQREPTYSIISSTRPISNMPEA